MAPCSRLGAKTAGQGAMAMETIMTVRGSPSKLTPGQALKRLAGGSSPSLVSSWGKATCDKPSEMLTSESPSTEGHRHDLQFAKAVKLACSLSLSLSRSLQLQEGCRLQALKGREKSVGRGSSLRRSGRAAMIEESSLVRYSSFWKKGRKS